MIEYLLTLLFSILYVYPLPRTPLIKLVEICVIIFVSYKNALLGIICAAVFIKEFPPKKRSLHFQHTTRMTLDEQMRPKDSNTLFIPKSTGLSADHSLIGQITKPFVENHTGNYSPF
jgi:hypothetical protein